MNPDSPDVYQGIVTASADSVVALSRVSTGPPSGGFSVSGGPMSDSRYEDGENPAMAVHRERSSIEDGPFDVTAFLCAIRPRWFDRAACRNADMNLFFPQAQKGIPRLFPDQNGETAKAICTACPVQATCLEWALTEGISDGILGGVGPRARRTLRAKRNRVA